MSLLTYDLAAKKWVRADGPVTPHQRTLLEIQHVQNPVTAWARRHNIEVVRIQGAGNRSRMDCMFAIPGGVPFFIEFKRPGAEPTELQTHTILRWKSRGYDVEVHDTRESAIVALTTRLAKVGAL